jgi:hypothetical protein
MFRFADNTGNKSVELYDMTGRKLQIHTVTEEEGSVILPLNQVVAGMYQVVMRQNGQVVQQSKLSVTK